MNEEKEKIHIDINHFSTSIEEKKSYRSRWLNHLNFFYELSNMIIMLRLGIVKELTKEL
jgi:hypothetical protein